MTHPVLRVLRGDPSDEELAALVAVLATRAAAAAEVPGLWLRSAWGHPAAAVRQSLTPGPDGWRRSALPR
ncbi:MAG: acyl-CoA carboxylase subunit epsilon [Nocardioidaceae bacterium]|nr:acyl-CoA carboxylase subunit epsilon [Nocardioidaceae bacterium]